MNHEHHQARILLAIVRRQWAEAGLLLDQARPHVPFPPVILELEQEIREHSGGSS